MDKDETVSLIERNVVRRGLLAGLLALGAGAVANLASPGKAHAQGDALIVGNTGSMTGPQTATAKTIIHANHAGIGLEVLDFSIDVAPQIAIIGTTRGPGKVGILGKGNSGAVGIFGSSDTPQNTAPAIQGVGNSTLAPAIHGASGNNGTGVKGVSNSTADYSLDGTGSGIGVHGKSSSGPGVQGVSSTGIGVRGASPSGIGVQGVSDFQPGVEGISVTSLGVRGTSTNFVGVVGVSTNNHGLYGFSGSASGSALVGDNAGGGLAGIFNGRVEVYGSFQVFGVKNAVLKMPDGTNALVYCQESPEPYFEDFGKAQLSAGVASIAIERDFATLVAGGEYLVFLTPEGDTRGLFVSRKGPAGFEVREVQGGTANVPFTYRIVTKRKDVEGKRFARVSGDGAAKVAATRAALGVPGTPNPGPGNPPFVPTQPVPGPFVPNPAPPVGPADGGSNTEGPRRP